MNAHSKVSELRTLLEEDLACHKQLYELKVLEADQCKLVASEALTVASYNRHASLTSKTSR